MSDLWLIKLASQESTDVDALTEALSELPFEELREFAIGAGLTPLDHTEAFTEKLAVAEDMGRELAHQMAKQAFAVTEKGHQYDAERAGLLKNMFLEDARHRQEYQALGYNHPETGKNPATLGNALRFGGIFQGVHPTMGARHQAYVAEKHQAGKNAWNPMGGSLTPLPEEEGATTGFFGRIGRVKGKAKVAGLGGTLMGLGRSAARAVKPMAGRALSFAERSPGAAMAIGGGALGAAGGALSGGGVDPATGQKRSRLGRALVGGALGAGAGYGASKIPIGGGFNVGDHASGLAALGTQGLNRVKLAMALSAGPNGSPEWLDQFKGTPLLSQAIDLEKQLLELDTQDAQMRAQDQQENEANRQKWAIRDQMWAQRDQLNIQKRQLALQLAEQEAGVGEAPPMEAAPEPMPVEPQAAPPAPAAAPAPAEGMPKMASLAYRMRFGR